MAQGQMDGWLHVKMSLRPFAGKEARLQLTHRSTGHSPTAGYWASVKRIESSPE